MATKKDDAENAGQAAAAKVGEQKAAVVDDVAKDLAKDAVRQEAQLATGNESTTEDISQWANLQIEANKIDYILDFGLEALKKAIDPKAERPIPEEYIAGALALERNGKNRTDFVKAYKDRLGIKDVSKELPQAGGPDYTNDVSSVSDL